MQITYDQAKRDKTLAVRGLDFEDAPKVFAGPTLTLLDERQDYGEDRYQTYGLRGARHGGLDPAQRGSPGSPRHLDEKMQ